MRALIQIAAQIIKKVILPLVVILLLVHLFFYIDYTAKPNVYVTWSIDEPEPADHALTINGQQFSLAAGESLTMPMELWGGGNGSVLFTRRGWSLRSETILVDGSPACIHNIRCFDREGELEVLGMARDPAMCAEISLEHCEICYGKKGVAALRKL